LIESAASAAVATGQTALSTLSALGAPADAEGAPQRNLVPHFMTARVVACTVEIQSNMQRDVWAPTPTRVAAPVPFKVSAVVPADALRALRVKTLEHKEARALAAAPRGLQWQRFTACSYTVESVLLAPIDGEWACVAIGDHECADERCFHYMVDWAHAKYADRALRLVADRCGGEQGAAVRAALGEWNLDARRLLPEAQKTHRWTAPTRGQRRRRARDVEHA
jgi:hypothetical protein